MSTRGGRERERARPTLRYKSLLTVLSIMLLSSTHHTTALNIKLLHLYQETQQHQHKISLQALQRYNQLSRPSSSTSSSTKHNLPSQHAIHIPSHRASPTRRQVHPLRPWWCRKHLQDAQDHQRCHCSWASLSPRPRTPHRAQVQFRTWWSRKHPRLL
jgi:hypothetical protein